MAQEPITTYCPACGKAFRVPVDLQGKKILCKSCQTHFVVQADRPGIPAAAPPAPARAAHGAATTSTAPHGAAHVSHGPTGGHGPSTASSPAKVPSAPAAHPPVTVASAAPVAVPPPVSDALAPIPFDDSPIPSAADGPSAASLPSVGKPVNLEKVKIESKGPYFVIKLVTAGKMIHVNIENSLNQHAADGWKLEQVITVGGDAYAILSRFHTNNTPPAGAE